MAIIQRAERAVAGRCRCRPVGSRSRIQRDIFSAEEQGCAIVLWRSMKPLATLSAVLA